MNISPGTHWFYVGPGGGQNVRHVVTSVDAHEVTTWGEGDMSQPGYSWIGSKEDFLKCFRPVGKPPAVNPS